MDKNRELIKNTIILFVGKFCTQFITLLLLPLYTSFLTTEDYGIVDLIQTYLTLLIPVLFLKIEAGTFRFLLDVRNNKEEQTKIITTTLVCFFRQSIISTIIFICLICFIEINYAPLIYINLITLGLLQVCLQIARGIGKTKTYSISSIISAIVTITLNIILLVFFKTNGSGVLFASAIANIVSIVFLIVVNKLYQYFNLNKYEKQYQKEIVKYSIPMIPNELSWWIVHSSDRTIISIFLGMSANGIYTVSCKFSSIVSSIFNIFNMSWQESASLHINDKDKDEFFSNVTNMIFNLFTGICLLLIACIPFIFNIIIDANYSESYYYIPILLFANVFHVLLGLFGGIYVAKKLTKEASKTTIFSALINIIVHLALIKFIGIYAAAISTLVAYITLAIYRYIDMSKYAKIKIPFSTCARTIIAFIITMILYYQNTLIGNIINICISLIFSVYINKNSIYKLLKFGKNLFLIKRNKI